MAEVHGSQPHPATCDELATRDANRTSYPGRIDELIDELLAPDYVNLAMPDADLAAFKATVPAMTSVVIGRADR